MCAYTIFICLIERGVVNHGDMTDENPIETMSSLSPERETCIALEELGLLLRQLGADPGSLRDPCGDDGLVARRRAAPLPRKYFL